MIPFYQDNHIKIFNKDCRSMDELPDESVQCVVTSPPYWGLRKYAGNQDLIWGDNHCEHEWGQTIPYKGHKAGETNLGKEYYTKDTGNWPKGLGNICQLCGSWRGAYGLEPTPEMYVQHTIEILREIRRVLRKDGVVFWNIGDSYASQGGPVRSSIYDIMGGSKPTGYEKSRTAVHTFIKPKDLCLIPFRIAIATQEDGWWVRSVIIWSKLNPMPESVKDRPTESHEYILMLTKGARYYWDLEAVREPLAEGSWERAQRSEITAHSESRIRNKGTGKHGRASPMGRNIRTVWEFPTMPYPEAHFAVFPEKLPELCIKAASKENDIVLDPFAGAGTTLWVAKKLNRQSVGYELSEEYCQLAMKRNIQQVLT